MEAPLLVFINILVLTTVNAMILIFISIRMGNKNYLLGWSLLFYSLFFLVYFLWFHAGWILKFPHLIRTINPLMFLTAPFFYFYIRNSLFDQKGLDLKDTVHFLPALLHVLDLLPFYLMDYERKLELAKMFVENPKTLNLYANGVIPTYWVDSFRIILMTAYIAYSMWLLLRFHPKWVNPFVKESWTNTIPVVFFLFLLITFGYFSYHTFWMVEILVGIKLPGLLQFFTWVTLIALAMLSIYLHLNPEKVFGLQPINESDNYQNREFISESNLVKNNGDPPEHHQSIYRIRQLLEQKEVFLMQELKVGDFAAMVGVNSRDLGMLLHKVYQRGFRELINHHRVNFAVKKLESGYLDSSTLDSLSQESGFNNRVTFFNAFKKEKGLSPTEYWLRYQGGENLN